MPVLYDWSYGEDPPPRPSSLRVLVGVVVWLSASVLLGVALARVVLGG